MQELEYYEKYGNSAAPGATMDEVRPGYSDYTQTGKDNQDTADTTTSLDTQMDTDNQESSSSTSTTKKGGGTKTTTTNATTTKTTTSDVNTDVLWQGELISVKTWGFHSSVILVDGKEQSVPTHELTFSEKVDVEKRLAYIHAPRTGKCSLRAKASDKGDVLDKCPAGTIVQVVSYGKSYCQIVFEGQVGYVLTSCLKFCGADAEIIGTGVLTYNGKATGRTTINIRNAADGDSEKIAEWRTGTQVQVFALKNGWYEIEFNGIHGYVMQKFLTMEE